MRIQQLFVATALASTMMLGSCSNDHDEYTQQRIVVTTDPVEIRLSSGNTGMLYTRAAEEDGVDFDTLGVFALARHTLTINQAPADINWWGTHETELTACKLFNIPSKKEGANVNWVDNTAHYYYPMTQFYAYDFYAYYPYKEDSELDKSTANKLYVDYTIDGSTDIIWGRAASTDSKGFSSAYFTQDMAHFQGGEYMPQLNMRHLLTRLVFYAVPAPKHNGSTDADAYDAAELMQVKSIKVVNAYTDVRLRIADLENDAVSSMVADCAANSSDTTWWAGRLLLNSATHDTLSLKDKPISDGIQEDLTPTMVPNHSTYPSGIQLGESIMLYPQSFYKIQIVLLNTGDGVEHVSEIPLIIQPDGQPFNAGSQYNVNLRIGGPQEIKVTAVLADWVDGGDITVDLH